MNTLGTETRRPAAYSNSYHHQNFVKVQPIDLQHNTNAAIVQSSVSKNVYETSSVKLAEQQPEAAISTSKSSEFWNCLDDEKPIWENFQISKMEYAKGSLNMSDEILFSGENSYRVEQAEIVEKIISKLCFSENPGRPENDDLDDDYDDSTTAEITTVYEMLANKPGLKYSLLKDVILDQLLMAYSNYGLKTMILMMIGGKHKFALGSLSDLSVNT
ncbi:hypothetical protein QVD17_35761 [Tagetes erecta]|uniref:Putative E3 ubiquitin-protein ligase LIN ARM repeats domain-containing protein n=1 Tax=Tagetes erecta TaxID=13708 RepID=A0AAD8JR32_TARER|nr:hypothetical protein QVD17_35761 [Tagetes erecta]